MIIEFVPPRTFLFATQAVAFSVLLFVFYVYYKTFLRKYVKYWSMSIAALSLAYLLKSLLTYTKNQSSGDNWQAFFELLLQVCQYSFLIFLVFGVLNAKTNKAISKKLTRGGEVPLLCLAVLLQCY